MLPALPCMATTPERLSATLPNQCRPGISLSTTLPVIRNQTQRTLTLLSPRAEFIFSWGRKAPFSGHTKNRASKLTGTLLVGGRGLVISVRKFVHVELSPYSNYSVLSKQKYQEELQIGIDDVINAGSNFTIRQYDLLALAYLACSLRKGRLLTVTTHREVDFSYSSNAHGDPKDFDFTYFYQLIESCLGLTGIQHDRAYFHSQTNLDGYMNEFWAFVKKQAGALAANQYGTPKRFPGNPKHLYVNEI